MTEAAYNLALSCIAQGLSRTETWQELTEAYRSLDQGYIREAMADAYRDALRSGVDPFAQIIDSRDLIEELDRIDAEDEDDLDEEEREIKAAIEELAEEVEDWQYGAALIREDYFQQYAEQLAEDIGAIDADASWPLSYIDWEAAADALKQDYSEVEFLGKTYYVRS